MIYKICVFLDKIINFVNRHPIIILSIILLIIGLSLIFIPTPLMGAHVPRVGDGLLQGLWVSSILTVST